MGVAQSCCSVPPPKDEPVDPKAIEALATLSDDENEPAPAPPPPELKAEPVDNGPLAAAIVKKAIAEALEAPEPMVVWEPVPPKPQSSRSCLSCAGRKSGPGSGIDLKKVFSGEKLSCLSRELKQGKDLYSRVTHPTHQVSECTQCKKRARAPLPPTPQSISLLNRSPHCPHRRSRQHRTAWMLKMRK